MPPGRPHSAARRSFVRYAWAIAAALGVACSVFPDQAVLPSGSGGSGGNAGTGLGGEHTTGGQRATGGASAGFAGNSGSPNAGGAEGGSSEAGSAGRGDSGAGGSTSETGGAGGATSAGGSTPETGGAGGSTPETGGAGGSTSKTGGAGGAGASSSGGQGGSVGCTIPTVSRLEATADTYLSEAKNQQQKNYANETSLLLSGVTNARANVLVSFDLSTLPTGRTITRATLRFVLVAPVAGDRTLSIYLVGRPWREDKADWLRATTGPAVNWAVPGGDTALVPSDSALLSNAALAEYVDFDVSADVKAMILSASANPNNGWLVAAAPSDETVLLASRDSLFAQNHPTLIVELCP